MKENNNNMERCDGTELSSIIFYRAVYSLEWSTHRRPMDHTGFSYKLVWLRREEA